MILKCHCNEQCYFINKTCIINKENKKYVQVQYINKCKRFNDNIKKKPCNFIII